MYTQNWHILTNVHSNWMSITVCSYLWQTCSLHYFYIYSTVYSEVHLTQQSPLGLPCSGETVVLQCTLQGTAVIWSFPGGDETLVPSSSEQVTGNFRARPVDTVNGNFTSTLTFPAENETVITCFNALRSRNASLTVIVQGISVFHIYGYCKPNIAQK